MIIRRADDADVRGIFLLYREMLAETNTGPALSDNEHDWAEVGIILDYLIDHQFVLVAIDNGEYVGYEIATIEETRPPKKKAKILTSVSTYIKPSHRKGWLARKLVNEALTWGRENGCDYAECRTNIGSPAQTLLERGGFKVYGVEMRMEL